MSHSSKPLTLAIGAAIAAGSMFSMQAMAQGYMLDAAASSSAKAAEGSCGGKDATAAKAHHEGGCGMAKMDTDKDGRLSRAEFDAAHKGSEEKFAGHDGDGDGFITQAEMDAHHAEMKAKSGDGKGKEGKCGEGKCGEGKCGGNA